MSAGRGPAEERDAAGRAPGRRDIASSAVLPRAWTHEQIVREGLAALEADGVPGAPLVDGRILSVRATPADGTAAEMAIGLSVLPAGYATPAHRHRAEELATVLAGEGVIVIDDVEFPVTPGAVVLTPSMSEHSTMASEKGPLVVWWVYAPAGSEARWLEHARADHESGS